METVATFTIRPGAPSDHAAIVRIDEYARSHPERVVSLEVALAAGECLVAEEDGDIAGVAILNYTFFGFGFIPLILVAPSRRRRRVGLRLLAEAQVRCTSRKLFTSANASNKAAHALLAKAGFVRSGSVDNIDDNDPEIIFFIGSGSA
jgi:ribosomal protein S18 acetylase RimI-like enzyme